jgi:kynureninase
MAEFSRRSEQIAEHSELLRAEFKAAHGRSATAVEDMKLHAVATIATRPDKTKHSLAELTDQWRERASKSHRKGRADRLGLEPQGQKRPAASSPR